ncbi:MAG TPA: LysR substrate-binding domain-containing protein [Gammaproteobacteria bacterium]|nr:LysR substrate-binding domain-containing protein [Gammaproteobacteria bacterium]
MKLQQLRYLLAVIDNGLNMTQAAERLATSQPGVSKQLKLLEQELGLSLFVRKGKSLVALTPEGEEVAQRAGRIAQEVEAIRGISPHIYGEAAGRLSIGTTHTQARYVLPPVIGRFRDRYPDVTLDLHQGTSEQLAEMVEKRVVDFVIGSESRQRFPELLMLPCYRWDRVIIVPQGHPLAALQRRPTLEEVAEHPLVTYVFNFEGGSSLKQAFAARGLEPKIVFTARDADVIKTYVELGLGIGIVASMAQNEGAQGGLATLDAEGLFPRCTTWIGFRRDIALRKYMFDFIELFAGHLDERRVRAALACATQDEVDAQLGELSLPLLGGAPVRGHGLLEGH